MQDNTTQYVNNISYDNWQLAIGVGVGLAVLGLLGVGTLAYR